MSRRVEKHLPYFTVLDALQQEEGCPFCALEDKSVRRYLGTVLGENVNDPGVRAKLVRSKGYCCRHSAILLEMDDSLGTAMLCQDQVKLVLDLLNRLEMKHRLLPRDELAGWKKREQCPACELQRQDRKRHVEAFVAGLGEDELRSAFEAGPGLCMPHFIDAWQATKDSQAHGCLVRVQRAKMSALLADLQELCRKFDYRFSHEPRGKEAGSWTRAVKMLAGAGGVFQP